MIRCAVGAGGRFGAVHSQIPATWYQGVPGLRLVAPATPADAKALLKASMRDQTVIHSEHKRLYATSGVPPEDEVLELDRAAVVRAGEDLTFVSVMRGVGDCLAAARELSRRKAWRWR